MADEQNEQDEQAEAAEAKPKKSKKLLIAIIAVVLLGGAGGGYFYFSTPDTAEADAEAGTDTGTAAEVREFLELETFIVNLDGGTGSEFLRVSLALGLGEQGASGRYADTGYPVPLIRDTIFGVLTTWEAGELLTAEGKERLKAEVIRALSERLGDLGVQDVYFDEFLVQR